MMHRMWSKSGWAMDIGIMHANVMLVHAIGQLHVSSEIMISCSDVCYCDVQLSIGGEMGVPHRRSASRRGHRCVRQRGCRLRLRRRRQRSARVWKKRRHSQPLAAARALAESQFAAFAHAASPLQPMTSLVATSFTDASCQAHRLGLAIAVTWQRCSEFSLKLISQATWLAVCG